jgi:hypothetical protein
MADPVSMMAVSKVADKASSFVPSMGQIALAAYQYKQLKDLKPSNYIPPALREMEQMARTQAGATVQPGETAARRNINQQTGTAVRNIQASTTSGSQALQGAARVAASGQESMMRLQPELESIRERNRALLSDVLGARASQERINQDQYTATKSALTEGMIRNLYGGLTGAAETAVATDMFGTNQTATEETPSFKRKPMQNSSMIGMGRKYIDE